KSRCEEETRHILAKARCVKIATSMIQFCAAGVSHQDTLSSAPPPSTSTTRVSGIRQQIYKNAIQIHRLASVNTSCTYSHKNCQASKLHKYAVNCKLVHRRRGARQSQRPNGSDAARAV